MRRVVFASCVLVLLVVAVSAQPPGTPIPPPVPTVSSPGNTPGSAPAPPAVTPPAPPGDPVTPKPPEPLPLAGMSTAPLSPSPITETPLSKFEPLAAFPAVTQFAVRGSLLGSSWLAKMHQPHGRFLHGYNPTLRQLIGGEHDLKQAQVALAVAQSAKFSGDQKQAAIAGQTILALLAATKVSPTDPNCREPVQASVVCNRVGFAAVLALAIYELPSASDKLVDDAERLCAFLRAQIRTDGSIDSGEGAAPMQGGAAVNEYPGFALHALALSNRVRPAEWKKDAVKRGVAYYSALFHKKPHPVLAATVTPAATELYLQTKLPEAAAAAFEMNDWLCGIQVGVTDPRNPQWAGSFRWSANGQPAPPGAAETGLYVQSLACAYQLTRATADLTRERKFRPALLSAVDFLCGLQFLEANTRHFENGFRANMLIGGFHLSPDNGNLHTDATACAVTGLLRYLGCGAERGGP